jgi:hypothetical protein
MWIVVRYNCRSKVVGVAQQTFRSVQTAVPHYVTQTNGAVMSYMCCPQFKVSKIYVFSGVCVLNLHTPASADSFYYY